MKTCVGCKYAVWENGGATSMEPVDCEARAEEK